MISNEQGPTMEEEEAPIKGLRIIIHRSVRALAIFMEFVIVMGVVDVGWTLYQRLVSPPAIS